MMKTSRRVTSLQLAILPFACATTPRRVNTMGASMSHCQDESPLMVDAASVSENLVRDAVFLLQCQS